jgi:hypothetical protein
MMSTAKVIPAVEARVHFGDVMRQAVQDGTHFIVEKSGMAMVAIMNAGEYARLVGEREERFRVLERIRAKAPDVTAAEAQRDVASALDAVRGRERAC